MTEHVPSVTPYLYYRDALAAIEFLKRALGFEVVALYPGDGREVMHSELRFENGLVMVSSLHDATPRSQGGLRGGIAMYTEDIDAHYQRALAAGAEITAPLETKDYGGKGYSLRDPEGNDWSVGSYAPGQPQ